MSYRNGIGIVMTGMSMLTSIAAAPPEHGSFRVRCADTEVRFTAEKSWTPDIIRQNGAVIAQENGFSGLVAAIGGQNSWYGSGHTEGGREQVESFQLRVDGKETALPAAGSVIVCRKLETVKESRLGSLKLRSRVGIEPREIREEHDLTAEAEVKIDRLYGFLHCWNVKTTDWMYQGRDGRIEQGKFVSDGNFKLMGDIAWAAGYLPEAQTVIFTSFPPDLPPGEGRRHCFWDIVNYHKQYYQAMERKRLKKGDRFHYRMTTRLLAAAPEQWEQVAKTAGTPLTSAPTAPAAAVQPGFAFVNLRQAVNMGFADAKAGDRTGGWFDQGQDNDLRTFPTGIRQFGGIPFDIIAPAANAGKSCVVLRGNGRNFLPLDTGAIPVDRKAGMICFLTACGWNTSIDTAVATVTVRFRQGGLYLDIPVRYKTETGSWWRPEPIPGGDLVWTGRNSSADIGVYCFGWVNPYPDQEIDTITIVSTNSGAVPAFLAATMVTDAKLVAKLKQQLRRAPVEPSSPSTDDATAELAVDFRQAGKPVPPEAASLALGFNIGKEYLAAAQNLVRAGRGKPFMRVQVGIAEPSPAEGVMDFTKLDRYVDMINAAGGEPMLCFGPGGPVWMGTPTAAGTVAANWKPRLPEEYAAYCEQVVRHYNLERKTPIRWWQFGNETELKGWSYKYYVTMYNRIVPRLRKVDPAILVGGPVNCTPNIGWAGELLREAGGQVDFLSYHQYGYSEPFDSPDRYIMGRTTNYREAVAAYVKLAETGRTEPLPVIVSEANINPRYKKPQGTDPRIHALFNAPWYMSALANFTLGGGRAMCFFTLDGGFGACGFEKGVFRLYPVYHTLWLFRKLALGKIIPVKSSSPLLEAYAFADGAVRRLIVINKNAAPVTVKLTFADGQGGRGRQYVLDRDTADAASRPDSSGNIPVLPAADADWSKKQISFRMNGYEVRGWESSSETSQAKGK